MPKKITTADRLLRGFDALEKTLSIPLKISEACMKKVGDMMIGFTARIQRLME